MTEQKKEIGDVVEERNENERRNNGSLGIHQCFVFDIFGTIKIRSIK